MKNELKNAMTDKEIEDGMMKLIKAIYECINKSDLAYPHIVSSILSAANSFVFGSVDDKELGKDILISAQAKITKSYYDEFDTHKGSGNHTFHKSRERK